MAILTNDQRKDLWIEYMSTISARREGLSLTKAELRAAVDAVDDWIDGNIASFNSSLPLPARTALTAKQKVELFFAVARARFQVT